MWISVCRLYRQVMNIFIRLHTAGCGGQYHAQGHRVAVYGADRNDMKRAQLAVSCLLLCSFSSADLCVPFRNCQDQRIEDIVSVWNQSNIPNPSTESDTPFRLQVVWKPRATALYGFSNHVPDDCGYEYSGELVCCIQCDPITEWHSHVLYYRCLLLQTA